MKYVKIALAGIALSLTAAITIKQAFPQYIYMVKREDQLVEHLSAFFDFAAFLTGVFCMAKAKRYRLTLAAVSLVALLGFLDEVSFGARTLDYKVLRIDNVPMDGTHDFIYLANVRLTEAVHAHPVAAWTGIAVGLALALLAVVRYHRPVYAWVRQAYPLPSFILACLFVMLLTAATLCDMEWSERVSVAMAEEVFEMNLGIILGLLGLSLYEASREGPARACPCPSQTPGNG